MQYDFYNSDVYSKEIVNFFWSVYMYGLVENFTIGIFSDIINVIHGKLCMLVLLIELDLFIPLSMTLTIFQGHSSVKQF